MVRAHTGLACRVRSRIKRLEAMIDEATSDIHGLSKQRDHLPTAFNAAKHILDLTLSPATRSRAWVRAP